MKYLFYIYPLSVLCICATLVEAAYSDFIKRIGCYNDHTFDRVFQADMLSSTNLTIDDCAYFCRVFIFFGLENGNECYCGDNIAFDRFDEIPAPSCETPCGGAPGEMCGGYAELEAYMNIQVYEYIGCFDNQVDALDELMSIIFTNMKAVDCWNHCKNSTYFGLHDDEQCRCGNNDDYDRNGISGSCHACVGDIDDTCGYSPGIGIYSTAQLPDPAMTPAPSAVPTSAPSEVPTVPPTPAPTTNPTPILTTSPTAPPTDLPTALPTTSPTVQPMALPTTLPTALPTAPQTSSPTLGPSQSPTSSPPPSLTISPTSSPTLHPTAPPSTFPTYEPSASPSTPSPQTSPIVSGEVHYVGDIIEDCTFVEGNIQIQFSGYTPNVVKKCDDGDSQEPDDENEALNFCNVGGFVHLIIEGYAHSEDDDVEDSCFLVDGNADETVVSNIVELIPQEYLENGTINYSLIIPYQQNRTSGDCYSGVDIVIDDTLYCKWYNETTNSWDSEGCESDGVLQIGGGQMAVQCYCQHLTAFAILQNEAHVRERCKLSSVMGNPVWVVACIMYFFVLLLSLLQLWRTHSTKMTSKSADIKIAVHALLCVVSALNIALSITLFVSDPRAGDEAISLILLSVLWACAYVLSFWTFALVVVGWARVCHTNIRAEPPRFASYFVYILGGTISILIIVLFVSAAVDDGKTNEITTVGSLLVGVICLCFAFLFTIYGIWLIRKVKKAVARMNRQGDKKNLLPNRLTVVTAVVSASFITESIVVIISGVDEVFYRFFTVFQFLYILFDVFMLLSVIYLFYHVVKTEYASQRSSSYSHDHPMSSGNVAHVQMSRPPTNHVFT